MSELVAYSPEGNLIVGTLEKLQARADAKVSKGADGKVAIEHEGHTKIFWDTQETVTCVHTGQTVYLDDAAGEWLESQLQWHPEGWMPGREDDSE